MATAPSFAATVLIGSAAVSATADTGYGTPANAVSVLAAGTSGSRIDEIDVQGTGTTSLCVVTVWRYDGTNYHLIDTIQVLAVTASTTVVPFQASKSYANLTIPSGSSLYVSCTVASQPIVVNAYGASF